MASRAAVKWLWLDELGNRIPAATVEVFEPGTTTKIAQTIYVNDDPDASVYPNPFTSDANGIASFFLVNSRRVDLRFSKTGYATQTISSVDATKPSLGYNVLQDEGVALTSRDILNITGAGATVTDDAANGRTNVTILGGGALDDLSDVTITTPADDQYLRYNGTAWVNETVAGGGAVGDLLDWQFIRKTADESVTSSTAMQNDDHLLFAIGAAETWEFKFALIVTGSTAGDFKVDVNGPAGITGAFGGIGPDVGAAGITASSVRWEQATGLGTTGLTFGMGANNIPIIIEGIAIGGGTAGNIQLRWAQNTSDATATTIRTNSLVIARRIA